MIVVTVVAIMLLQLFLLQAQVFSTFEELNSSVVVPEIGTVGFVLDAQNLYIYTSMGWKEVQVCKKLYIRYFLLQIRIPF